MRLSDIKILALSRGNILLGNLLRVSKIIYLRKIRITIQIEKMGAYNIIIKAHEGVVNHYTKSPKGIITKASKKRKKQITQSRSCKLTNHPPEVTLLLSRSHTGQHPP